ncbi:MAG TPA: HAD-IIIC family phosphatase [Candidatus Dormibacteraeota bacterium]|nr:HAD-IIIC family phosphatase [Candidatus Dormibacteraeota bacterium]
MSLVKCVVWDLDETVWPGVAIESDAIPEPHAHVLALLDELEHRGVVSSVASRSDPALADALPGVPGLAGRFVAAQVGWEPKSDAIRRIAGTLGIGLDAVAFVDEDRFHRAEVAHALPEVDVLSVDELASALGRDGERFPTPSRLTDEGRRRPAMYRDEARRRRAEAGFAGGHEEFLRRCGMRLEVGPARPGDLDRLAELAERTHRLNSTARRHGREDVARWLEAGWLARARLADRFGDHGLIGLVAAERPAAPGDWRVELLAVSCRVDGRGVPAALLRWTMDGARAAGAGGLRALYRPNGKNVRLAVLLRQLGFARAGAEGETVVLRRPLAGDLPPYPDWLEIVAG